MNTTINRKKLVTAALGAAVAAATLPALALTSAPAAQAEPCERWGIAWAPSPTPGFAAAGPTFSQTNGTTGAIGFPNPAPTDPPVIASFSGTYAWARFRDGPNMSGRASGNIRGDDIHFSVLWDNGVTGDYRGTVDQNGIASGTTSGGGQTANWRFDKPLAHCPAPPPPEGGTKTDPNGPARRIGKAPIFATVKDEAVDVYESVGPEGGVNKLGFLPVDTKVKLVGKRCQPEDWCEVGGDNVPNGHGWVWGHLQLPY